MSGSKTFNCQLITPEAMVLDAEAQSVVLSAHDGQMGILRDRAPLLCKLGIGELRVTTAERTQRYYVDGGFAHVLGNQVTVLTQQALPTEQINADQARREWADLRKRGRETGEDAQAWALKVERAKVMARLAGEG